MVEFILVSVRVARGERVEDRNLSSSGLVILDSALGELILGLDHTLGSEHLQPLIIAVHSEPVQINSSDSSRGEGESDLNIVMIINSSNLWDQARG